MAAITHRTKHSNPTMEGRGTTNYDPDKPSYGFSTATTEFDDALIARGIVNFEQAMLAKGASPAEASRLTELHERECEPQSYPKQPDKGTSSNNRAGDGHDADDASSSSERTSDVDDDDDDEFLSKYRAMRIKEMKTGTSSPSKNHHHRYGDVIYISRPDWQREVTEASRDGLWVVVNLTRSSSSMTIRHDEMCDTVEESFKTLADQYEDIKFVSIPSTSAIENWPVENLPTIFCYRFGKLQQQLIGIASFGGPGLNSGRLEWRLANLGVLESDLKDDPDPDHYDRVNRTKASHPYTSNITSKFGGAMSQLSTGREEDDNDHYDCVD